MPLLMLFCLPTQPELSNTSIQVIRKLAACNFVAAEKFLGYLTHEILGQNVSVLLPESVAVHHDEYLQRYMETRKSEMIGKVRELKVAHFPEFLKFRKVKRKGGELVDAHVWVTVVEVGNKIWFTGSSFK